MLPHLTRMWVHRQKVTHYGFVEERVIVQSRAARFKALDLDAEQPNQAFHYFEIGESEPDLSGKDCSARLLMPLYGPLRIRTASTTTSLRSRMCGASFTEIE